jgi:hypothetical protein
MAFLSGMDLFPLGCVLREFASSTYYKYASSQILVRPCPAKKPPPLKGKPLFFIISELFVIFAPFEHLNVFDQDVKSRILREVSGKI